MTCYDCIHCGACSDAGDSGFSCLKEDVSKCEHFKSKADYAEVKHGEWVLTKTEVGWNCCEYPTEYTCSECGRTEPQEEPYCNCGAKMDGRRTE